MPFQCKDVLQVFLAAGIGAGTVLGSSSLGMMANETSDFEEEGVAMPKGDRLGMSRLYNPNSGEHFYTANHEERLHLESVGWEYEGVGWYAPQDSDEPVYRLYNPNAGDHHYTMSAAERDMLKKSGWRYEGVGWYSDSARQVTLYRQYNPNAKTGTHNYTASKAENDCLCKIGWRGEGIGWYGVAAGEPETPVADYRELYRPVVEKVRKGIAGESVSDEYRIVDPIGSQNQIYYALEDMNGDSIPELAITNANGAVYFLYTIVNNKPVYVTSGWMRAMVLYPGSKFVYLGTGGRSTSSFGLFTIDRNGKKEWSEFYFTIPDGGWISFTCYFNTTGVDDPNVSKRVSEDEFRKKTDPIINSKSALICKPLGSY